LEGESLRRITPESRFDSGVSSKHCHQFISTPFDIGFISNSFEAIQIDHLSLFTLRFIFAHRIASPFSRLLTHKGKSSVQGWFSSGI